MVVAGDGTGYAHLLVPESEDVDDWTYEEFILYDSAVGRDVAQTIGAIALLTRVDGCSLIRVLVFKAGRVVAFDRCVLYESLPELRKKTAAYLVNS